MVNYDINRKIIPKVTYNNLILDKSRIYEENYKKSGIYRWNNKITGKSYVGSSINLANRFSIYFSKKAMLSKLSTRISIIYSAILKYEHINFSLDILEYCEINLLIEREQYYLDLLKPDYNILTVANSRLGSIQSEATKMKISISNKGKLLGKTHTYETRKKISLSLKSIIRTIDKFKFVRLETRLKLSLRSHGVSIKMFNSSGKFIKSFPTITSTAKHFSVSNRTISRYLNNNKIYNGYIFISNFKNN